MKALLDKEVNPLLAVTYSSSYMNPLSRYMDLCLQIMEEHFLRPVLEHLWLTLGAASFIELVELVAGELEHDEDWGMGINALIIRSVRDRHGAEHTTISPAVLWTRRYDKACWLLSVPSPSHTRSFGPSRKRKISRSHRLIG